MAEYEMISILEPCDDKVADILLRSIEEGIKSIGGQTHETEKWGMKKLAYPIRQNKEGYYIRMTFFLEKNNDRIERLESLESGLNIQEGVMKFIIVKTSEDDDYEVYDEVSDEEWEEFNNDL